MQSQLSSPTETLTFGRDGAQLFEAALDSNALADIRSVVSRLPQHKAGVRLQGLSALDRYLRIDGAVGSLAAAVLGARAKPVRAILFDKTALANWRLGWHQDRTIAVKHHAEVAGYGPWTMKAGVAHVAPPFDLLAEMITLRVHLDAAGAGNGPLLIAPGSHRLGRISEADIGGAVKKCGSVVCLAEAGDVWLYATPILHASEAALSPTRRRVLQVDYSSRELPDGLVWQGI
jgi:hypothetical protein